MGAKVWAAVTTEFTVFAGLLFGAAGTPSWPQAWAFLVLFFGAALAITRRLARDDPALLEERMKPFVQKRQPVWDQVLLAAIAVIFIAWLVQRRLEGYRDYAARVRYRLVPFIW